MTEETGEMTIIHANCTLLTNHRREYETLDTVELATGEFEIRAKTVILAAGEVHEIPTALANELFEMAASDEARGGLGCVRMVTDRERQCFNEARASLTSQR